MSGSRCARRLRPARRRPLSRLAKFKREQLIVDTLNRGVSVAEIAARVGVGEKRMRAIIRDPRTGIRGLARRMPHPPEEFVAIQLSRLNEALLVAFSAMSPTNLKAVDQVVKIVRELDRYGGAFAAEWARPEVSPRIIPVSQPGDPGLDDGEDSPAFLVAALPPGQSPGVGDAVDDRVYKPAGAGERPENPAQPSEKVDSAPGISTLVAALPPGQSPGVGDAVDDRVYKVAGAGERPENPAQRLEKVDSAPGVSTPVAALPPGQSPGVGDAVGDRVYKAVGAGERPENPAQSPEKIDSAPEVGPCRRAPPGQSPGRHAVGADVRPENPAQTSEKVDSAPGVSALVAALPAQSPVGDAVDDRVYKPAGAGERPENPPQGPEKVDSAPGKDWLAGAAAGSGRGHAVRTAIPAPPVLRHVPMIPDGAIAC